MIKIVLSSKSPSEGNNSELANKTGLNSSILYKPAGKRNNVWIILRPRKINAKPVINQFLLILEVSCFMKALRNTNITRKPEKKSIEGR